MYYLHIKLKACYEILFLDTDSTNLPIPLTKIKKYSHTA